MTRYKDVSATCQLIGNIYNNPKLLEMDSKYTFVKEDFCDELQRICFSAIYNLYQLGTTKIDIATIETYLASRPKASATFKAQKGEDFILKCAEMANAEAFDYYYNRTKKMTLLRAYNELGGMDLSWLYDPDELDSKKLQEQEDKLDNMSLEQIGVLIDKKLDEIKSAYVSSTSEGSTSIGDGVFELLDELKESPDFGIPLFGDYINTVTRGARFGKFYLRSAPSNVGKTRMMVADMCYIGCDEMYSLEKNDWVKIGTAEPSYLITTEQSQKEVQQMCLAFLSGVDEDKIVLNRCSPEEYKRILHAAEVLTRSNLLFEEVPDFSLQDIENKIKYNVNERKAKYIAFDYIHTSLGILEEITRRSGGVKLREDNILFMLSVKIKDIANKYDVFIISSTQLNGDWKTSETPDMNLLRGAKAIADKIDMGFIALEVTPEDVEKIKPVLTKNNFPTPNIKMSVYKNRANGYKGIYLWMCADKGICRYNTVFVTTWDYRVVDIENIKIKIKDEPEREF